MFRATELKDSKEYRDFLAACPLATLQQSFSWADFQGHVPGRDKSFALAVRDESEKLVLTALVNKISLPLGRAYYYIQRGPLFANNLKDHEQAARVLFSALQQRAKKDKAIFLRIETPFQGSEKDLHPIFEFYKAHGFRKAHAHFFPEHTLMIDLTKSETEILAQMKQKGRYNIRLAEKKGVEIIESKQLSDVEHFYNLLRETLRRDKFSGHNVKFYRDMLEVLGKQNLCSLFMAKYEDRILAANLVTFFKDTVTYYYGASSNQDRNLMAPYLLQWKTIQLAKQRGYKYYDFLGIAPEGASKHPWLGVTEFKLKFGGARVSYLPAQEFVYHKVAYFFLIALKKLRNLF
ncbi:MAG: peptidoglycan bridge formation glycyltransferase FemA/FemB family protein [Candidatus Gracilibacteria bacterium]|nr:peptidoglycan bridge formation glycyltransferase FemA/FemB family protein [Candidatus Gracilibacteria bacterium]